MTDTFSNLGGRELKPWMNMVYDMEHKFPTTYYNLKDIAAIDAF